MFDKTRAWFVGLVLLSGCATPMDAGDAGADAAAAGDADAARVDAPGGDAGCDADGDGHASIACGGDDCDDADPHRFPGNPEVCDAASHDEDCNPMTFGTTDVDADGFVSAACCNVDTGGTHHCGTDCDDNAVGVHPDAPEVCNGLDDDCDTAIDEGVLVTYYADCDGDLHGTDTGAGMACTAGTCMGHPGVLNHDDCDDTNAQFYPGALATCDCPSPSMSAETCNGSDDDCDATVDEGASASCPAISNGTVACVSGACAAQSCDAGYHACGAACASSASTMSCGSSCTPCTVPAHGSATCDGTSCGITCDAGYVPAGGACDLLAPRPIAPLSTATVTSRRPTLRWALASGTDGAHVELCSDRACTTVLATIDASGTSAAPVSDLPAGVVFWRLRGRSGSTTGMLTSPTWQFVVGARSAPVSGSWGTTLDVNGDGYADLAVGAPYASTFTGRVYVYLGGPSGLASTPATTLTGPDGMNAYFGTSVASAGDVNGDGYADLAVGSSSVGRAHVYLGGASGLSTTPATTLIGGSGGFFGNSVASAGDVNGDGYADLAVGAFVGGSAFVYLGSASGLSTSPATTLIGPDGAGSDFGFSVASADVNGDGYADLAIGGFGVSSNTGRAYVYLGGASGLATSPATTLTGPDGASGSFGRSVASADVNGDGYADLAVGAQGVNSSSGRAYVYLGGTSGLASTPATTLTGPDGTNGLFGHSVASAGDVNGDGYADLAVGANGASSGTGRAYVYLGSASGLATAPIASLTGPDGANGDFAYSVAGAGDVNGDGYADVVVGADQVSTSTGRAYVYLGGASGLASPPATSLTGPDGANADFGFSVASADAAGQSCRAG